MEKTVLSVEKNVEKFEQAKNELLKLDVTMSLVSTIQDAITELSKNKDYLLIVICPGDEEFLNQIKQLREITISKIIIMAEEYRPSELTDAIALGVDDYRGRPETLHESIAIVHASIRRTTEYNTKTPWCYTDLVVGQLKMSTDCHKVYINGVEIELNKREFDVLFFLAKHRQKYYSSREIFTAVWEDEDFKSYDTEIENTVSSLMKRLKKKLSVAVNPNEYIKNKPKVGYKLDPT